jgi:putative addiction module component (TIGR02574 family)
MALNNLAVAEEALSLSPTDRVELAKLLIQSLEGDARTDDEIRAELNRCLEDMISGKDPGLTFEQVFGSEPAH